MEAGRKPGRAHQGGEAWRSGAAHRPRPGPYAPPYRPLRPRLVAAYAQFSTGACREIRVGVSGLRAVSVRACVERYA
eukprot:1290465-Rhodomonas_salina.1